MTGAPGEAEPNLPVAPEVVLSEARAVLDANWRPAGGYTVPNNAVYPFQWLWDSCFHAVTWAVLGEGDRARREVAHLFRTQSRLGFVPHVDYEHDSTHHASFWRREGQSSITQPPMFGHAVAEMARRGIDVDDLVPPAVARHALPARRASPHRRAGQRSATPGRAGATTVPGGTTGAPGVGTRPAGTT